MLRTVSRLVPKLVLVAGSAAIGAAGAVALRADLLVGYGVSKALEGRKTARPFALATSVHRVDKAEVGDEIYWLTRSRGGAVTPVAFSKRLTVGDRIAITGRGGRARHLEVVDLTPVGAPIHHVADGSALARLVRVTCRVVGPAGRGAEELVRFYVEAEEAKPAALPAARQAPVAGLRQG